MNSSSREASIQKFWSLVDRSNGDCWMWLGPVDRGHGNFNCVGLRGRAHMIAWLLVNGSRPDKMFTLPTCGQKLCVNPAHRLPTQSVTPSKDPVLGLGPRFWSKVNKSGPNGCWLFTGALDPSGYGRYVKSGGARLAHRLSYEEANGPLGPGLFACHRCDNPTCVNPDHLFAGTALDNVHDAIGKGRLNPVRGSRTPAAKLTEEQAAVIKHSSDPASAVAIRFGISKSVVWAIRSGQAWKHVAILFIALSLVSCASTGAGRLLNVGVIASGVADLASTQYALDRGAVEANPVMGPSLWQQIPMKALGIGTVIGLAHLIEQKHPVLAHVLRGVVITGWSVVAIHNVKVTR